MARYRVLEKSFINNSVVEAGAEVDYEGEPGRNLELIEPAKKKAGDKKDEGGGE